MAILTVTNLSKAFTKEFLFQNLSFEVYENNKIGLIGPNGAGKTTLFRILLDIEGYDDGDIAFSKNTKIGYMEQHVCSDLEKTAYDEVLTIFSNLINNSAEACNRLAEKEKKISLRINVLQNSVTIVCENPIEWELDTDKLKGSTFKPDKANHGFGLYNIEKTISKYNGEMKLSAESGSFVVKILLYQAVIQE